MFSYLFTVVVSIILYQVFIEDDVKSFIRRRTSRKANITAAEKIAKVKAVSDDIKDIETFIARNADNLSNDIIDILVARIEEIRAENIIGEDSLKQRIADITIKEELNAPPLKSRSSRK
jgi:hypothetical protein